MRCGCQGISGLLRKALLWTAARTDSDTAEGRFELPSCWREAAGGTVLPGGDPRGPWWKSCLGSPRPSALCAGERIPPLTQSQMLSSITVWELLARREKAGGSKTMRELAEKSTRKIRNEEGSPKRGLNFGGDRFSIAVESRDLTLFKKNFFFKLYSINLFIYLWLHWVFVAVHRLSLVVVNGGYSSLQCVGFSLRWLLLLWSTGSRHMGFSSCGTQAQ